MKIILAFADPDDFFKVTLDERTLRDIKLARDYMIKSPFNGELWVDVDTLWLNCMDTVPGHVIVTMEGSSLRVFGAVTGDDLLQPDEYIESIPDVYLTRMFQIKLQDAEKYLSEREYALIATWEAVQTQN